MASEREARPRDDAHGYSSAIGDDGMPIDPKHPFNAG
jgi:hypothetical protein